MAYTMIPWPEALTTNTMLDWSMLLSFFFLPQIQYIRLISETTEIMIYQTSKSFSNLICVTCDLQFFKII